MKKPTKKKAKGKRNPAVMIAGGNPGGRHAKAKRRTGTKKKATKKKSGGGKVRVGRRNAPTTPGHIISDTVTEVRYIRRGDGRRYFHAFKAGVRLVAQADGSLRLYAPSGVPLWKDFPE